MLQKPLTSYKNMKYFTYCLKRNIPIFIIFGLYFILTLGFQFSQWLKVSSVVTSYYYTYSILSAFDTYIISVIALVAAIINFKFLSSRKMSDIYYSVPISKCALFWCNYFSGLAAIIIPYFLLRSPLISIIFKSENVDPQTYIDNINSLWGIFAFQTISLLLAYAVAVFFVVNFGKILDLCIYYISFSLLLPMVFSTVVSVLNNNIVGFTSSTDFLTNGTKYITLNGTATEKTIYLFVYIVLSIVASLVAFLLFRKRKSECCENAFAFDYFKVVISVTASLVFGIFTLVIFLGGKYDLNSLTVFSPFFFFGAIVAFLGTLVLSKRSFNILNKQLYFFAIPCVAFAVLISYLASGGFGRAAYVPEISEVESVSITRYVGEPTNQYYDYYSDEDYIGKNIKFSPVLYQENNIVFTEKESIKTVMAYHKSLLKEFEKYHYNVNEVISSEDYNHTIEYRPTIIYKLKNGTTVKRQYNYLPNDWQNDEFDAMIALKEPETSDLVALENYLLKNNIGDVECTYSSAFPLSEFVCKQNKIKIGKNDFIKLLKTIYQEEEYLYYSEDINTAKDYMEIKITDDKFNSYFGNLIKNGSLIIRDYHPNTIKLLKKLGFKESAKSYQDLDFSNIYAELIDIDSAEVNDICITDSFVIEGKSKSEIEKINYGYYGNGFSVFNEEHVETILKSATSVHQAWDAYAVRFTKDDSEKSKIYFISNDVLKDLQIEP